jgi:hypothetical protein
MRYSLDETTKGVGDALACVGLASTAGGGYVEAAGHWSSSLPVVLWVPPPAPRLENRGRAVLSLFYKIVI